MSAEISHPVPVAASGLEAVERQVDAPSAKLTSSLVEFEEFYEIDQTARIISEGGYRRVALQFPDEMLADSTCVAERLADLTGSKMFVLADTTYGSCCIDEVAAQHCDSDLIVHYGHTCLTLTSRIPVLFVYGRLGFDTDKFIQAFASQFASDVDKERRFALLYHVSYAYKICEVTERLKARGYHNVTKSNVRRSFEPYIPKDGAATSTTDRGCCSGCPVSASCEGPAAAEAPVPLSHQDYISRDASAAGSGEEFGIAGRTFDGLDAGSLAEHTIIYLGKEGPTLSNIMLTNSKSQVYSYNPDTDQLRCESAVVNRHLGRRYMMVQKAKDADIIGIVVGTLGAARYMNMLEDIKRMIRKARKKFYTFVVGKLNVPKLANFMEIEAFVVIACPENTIIDSKEFYRPVVTPYELKLALSRHFEWDGNYVTDFEGYLAMEPTQSEGLDDDRTDEDTPHFSLVTGTYKSSKYHVDYNKGGGSPGPDGSEVALRNSSTQMIKYINSAAADYLQSRSFKGLGADETQDSPEASDRDAKEGATVTEGKSGIARGYKNERQYQS